MNSDLKIQELPIDYLRPFDWQDEMSFDPSHAERTKTPALDHSVDRFECDLCGQRPNL